VSLMEDLKIELPEAIKKDKFPGLDGLRGISILLVIVAHLLKNYRSVGWATVLFTGVTGVNIFFVISGFLITTLLLKEKHTLGRISLKNFYIRRALRIVPPVYLYLIVLFFLKIIYDLKVSGKSLLEAALYLKNLPLSKDWYTDHFWSLGIEEQYYLIFPFLLTVLPLRIYKRLIIILIIVLPPLTYIYFKKIDLEVWHVNHFFHGVISLAANVLGRGICILVGSLFYILFLNGNRVIKRHY
jgi:peptidoglycan/LPS O-acetylase OafA/YrhL